MLVAEVGNGRFTLRIELSSRSLNVLIRLWKFTIVSFFKGQTLRFSCWRYTLILCSSYILVVSLWFSFRHFRFRIFSLFIFPTLFVNDVICIRQAY